MKLNEIIKKIKSKSKERTLRNAYSFVTNHFSNEKYNLILKFPKQFKKINNKLFEKKQFANCTLQNKILIKLLTETGQFTEKDFKKKRQVKYFGHQYLISRINNKKFIVDCFLRKFARKE